MKNKYITVSNQSQKIKELNKGLVEIEELKIANEFILITLSTKGDGIEEANLLDKLNTNIHSDLEEIFLVSCGSSEYYNKELYSLINSMERKLREFVYIAIIKNDTEQFYKLHGELEKLDFGELYKILFTDEDFIKGTKIIINKSSYEEFKLILDGSFSKEEILTVIAEIEEDTIWDKINDGESIPKLKKNFFEIKNFRNNVMHAHNIDQETYESANSLFTELNEELNFEIDNILSEKMRYKIGEDFTDNISSSLNGIREIAINKNIESLEKLTEGIKEYLLNSLLKTDLTGTPLVRPDTIIKKEQNE